MPFCDTHLHRWYDDKIGGCPACEHRNIQPDDALLIQWENCRHIDAHTKNATASKYILTCWHGVKERVEILEKLMRATIVGKNL